MRVITNRIRIFKNKIEHEINSVWDGDLRMIDFAIYEYYYPEFFFVKIFAENSNVSIEIGEDYA